MGSGKLSLLSVHELATVVDNILLCYVAALNGMWGRALTSAGRALEGRHLDSKADSMNILLSGKSWREMEDGTLLEAAAAELPRSLHYGAPGPQKEMRANSTVGPAKKTRRHRRLALCCEHPCLLLAETIRNRLRLVMVAICLHLTWFYLIWLFFPRKREPPVDPKDTEVLLFVFALTMDTVHPVR